MAKLTQINNSIPGVHFDSYVESHLAYTAVASDNEIHFKSKTVADYAEVIVSLYPEHLTRAGFYYLYEMFKQFDTIESQTELITLETCSNFAWAKDEMKLEWCLEKDCKLYYFQCLLAFYNYKNEEKVMVITYSGTDEMRDSKKETVKNHQNEFLEFLSCIYVK